MTPPPTPPTRDPRRERLLAAWRAGILTSAEVQRRLFDLALQRHRPCRQRHVAAR